MNTRIDFDPDALAWSKGDGLLPAIIQHWRSGEVLMLGYMTREALQHTLDTGRVTFWSRSRQSLWIKGETSGHWLTLKAIHADCDADTLLVQADPEGPICHQGTRTCFGEVMEPAMAFLGQLDELIETRERERPEGSYTTHMFESGTRRIAQKVGEEGVETALAAVAQDDDALLDESADLVYHLLVLLRARNLSLADVTERLRERHNTDT